MTALLTSEKMTALLTSEEMTALLTSEEMTALLTSIALDAVAQFLALPPPQMAGESRALTADECAAEGMPVGSQALILCKSEIDTAAKDKKCTRCSPCAAKNLLCWETFALAFSCSSVGSILCVFSCSGLCAVSECIVISYIVRAGALIYEYVYLLWIDEGQNVQRGRKGEWMWRRREGKVD